MDLRRRLAEGAAVEAELRTREERLRTLLHLATDSIFIKDRGRAVRLHQPGRRDRVRRDAGGDRRQDRPRDLRRAHGARHHRLRRAGHAEPPADPLRSAPDDPRGGSGLHHLEVRLRIPGGGPPRHRRHHARHDRPEARGGVGERAHAAEARAPGRAARPGPDGRGGLRDGHREDPRHGRRDAVARAGELLVAAGRSADGGEPRDAQSGERLVGERARAPRARPASVLRDVAGKPGLRGRGRRRGRGGELARAVVPRAERGAIDPRRAGVAPRVAGRRRVPRDDRKGAYVDDRGAGLRGAHRPRGLDGAGRPGARPRGERGSPERAADAHAHRAPAGRYLRAAGGVLRLRQRRLHRLPRLRPPVGRDRRPPARPRPRRGRGRRPGHRRRLTEAAQGEDASPRPRGDVRRGRRAGARLGRRAGDGGDRARPHRAEPARSAAPARRSDGVGGDARRRGRARDQQPARVRARQPHRAPERPLVRRHPPRSQAGAERRHPWRQARARHRAGPADVLARRLEQEERPGGRPSGDGRLDPDGAQRGPSPRAAGARLPGDPRGGRQRVAARPGVPEPPRQRGAGDAGAAPSTRTRSRSASRWTAITSWSR